MPKKPTTTAAREAFFTRVGKFTGKTLRKAGILAKPAIRYGTFMQSLTDIKGPAVFNFHNAGPQLDSTLREHATLFYMLHLLVMNSGEKRYIEIMDDVYDKLSPDYSFVVPLKAKTTLDGFQLTDFSDLVLCGHREGTQAAMFKPDTFVIQKARVPNQNALAFSTLELAEHALTRYLIDGVTAKTYVTQRIRALQKCIERTQWDKANTEHVIEGIKHSLHAFDTIFPGADSKLLEMCSATLSSLADPNKRGENLTAALSSFLAGNDDVRSPALPPGTVSVRMSLSSPGADTETMTQQTPGADTETMTQQTPGTITMRMTISSGQRGGDDNNRTVGAPRWTAVGGVPYDYEVYLMDQERREEAQKREREWELANPEIVQERLRWAKMGGNIYTKLLYSIDHSAELKMMDARHDATLEGGKMGDANMMSMLMASLFFMVHKWCQYGAKSRIEYIEYMSRVHVGFENAGIASHRIVIPWKREFRDLLETSGFEGYVLVKPKIQGVRENKQNPFVLENSKLDPNVKVWTFGRVCDFAIRHVFPEGMM
jgi:hypothetical protein